MQDFKEKFNNWNEIKQKIHFGKKGVFDISEGQIWFISMGENIGFEENGKGENFLRPVVVVKITGSTFFCVSLTSKGKNNIFHYKVKEGSFAILSQTKHLDRKRFQFKIGKINDSKFKNLKEKLKDFLL